MRPPEPLVSPNPRDRNRSRERLLKAATTLFATHGYHGTSTQQIATQAGVNQTTIFRLFHSKQALFQRVLERCIRDNAMDWIGKALRSSRRDKVVFLNLANQIDKALDPTLVRLMLYCGLEQPAQLRKLLRPSLQSFYRQVGDHIQERIQNGTLRELDPSSVCWALVAMLVYEKLLAEMSDEWKMADHKREDSHLLYLDIWLNGVLANPSGTLPAVKAPRAGFSKRNASVSPTLPRAASG